MPISGPVQEVTGNSGAVPVSNYPVTIAAPQAGNSLILCVETGTDGRVLSSVSGGGVTWAAAKQIGTTNIGSEIWFGHASSGSGTTITLTYTTKTNTSIGSCNITEWSGLNNAIPDATNSSSALANASPNPGTVTTAFANSLIIATGSWVGNDYSSGPTNSFTRRTSFNDTVGFGEGASRIVAANSTYSTAWTLTLGVNWAACIASFGAPNTGPTAAQASAGFWMIR